MSHTGLEADLYEPQVRDPASILDFGLDLEGWLDPGDTPASVAVTAVPDGLTIENEAVTATSVSAWISGGANGDDHQVTFHWVTVEGREDERTIPFHTRDR